MTDIALETGFASPSSFSRAFREAYGMTPTAWRSGGHRQHARISRDPAADPTPEDLAALARELAATLDPAVVTALAQEPAFGSLAPLLLANGVYASGDRIIHLMDTFGPALSTGWEAITLDGETVTVDALRERLPGLEVKLTVLTE